jgi:putative transposase
MSRFKKQSQTIWHCEYHIVWVPKYRYRVMAGKIKEEVELCVREQSRQMRCEVPLRKSQSLYGKNARVLFGVL